MDWVEQNWVLLAIGALIALGVLWLLLKGSSERSPEARTRDGVEQEISPVVTGPAAAPIDVPPPVDAVRPISTPEPEALAQPIHAVPAGPADELTRMKGVGPKVAAMLNGLGVTRYDQIAAWTDADVARIDAQLGTFKGRVTRDQWVEQARLLAAGDTAGFEAKFGKLG
jgi:predicted flap endonuclease-1-like 5' DNA nuclease